MFESKKRTRSFDNQIDNNQKEEYIVNFINTKNSNKRKADDIICNVNKCISINFIKKYVLDDYEIF